MQFSWRRKAVEMFGIDPRAMALFRMLIAVVLLVDLRLRLRDFHGMYTESGVMPVALAREYWGVQPRWSLFFLNTSDSWQLAIFVMAIVFALMLMAGCFTRVATFGCYVMQLSIVNRMPLVNAGGDMLILILLFWSLFLPLGQRLSVDALRRKQPPDTKPVLSAGTVCILLQFCLIYWFACIWKSRQEVWFNGDAFQYCFRHDVFDRALARWLLGRPALLPWLCFGTFVVEGLAPFLLVSPFYTARCRMAAVLIFWSFHLGIELTMAVHWFSQVCAIMWLLVIPPEVWDRIWPKRWRLPESTTDTSPSGIRLWLSRGGAAICFTTLFLVASWGVGGLYPSVRSVIPGSAGAWVLKASNLMYQWSMYGNPTQFNRWMIAEAKLAIGREVDLIAVDSHLLFTRPEELAVRHKNRRWEKYFTRLIEPGESNFADRTAEYLGEEWNATHGPEEQVRYVRLHLAVEKITWDPPKENLQIKAIAFVEFMKAQKKEVRIPDLRGLQDLGF